MKKPFIIILSVLGILLLIGLGIFVYYKLTYLSKEEVREIVLKDIGIDRNKIHFTKVELEIEENLYEVEFYYINQNTEYEYKINAKTGQIIYNDFKLLNNKENFENNNDSKTNTNTDGSSNITIDDAKKIALEHSKLNDSDVIFTEIKKDYDDRKLIYDLEFIYNNQEYSYEINSNSGEIVSYNKENLY